MKDDRIRITVVPRKEPDIGLYVQALIALARQLEEAQDEKIRTGDLSREQSRPTEGLA